MKQKCFKNKSEKSKNNIRKLKGQIFNVDPIDDYLYYNIDPKIKEFLMIEENTKKNNKLSKLSQFNLNFADTTDDKIIDYNIKYKFNQKNSAVP